MPDAPFTRYCVAASGDDGEPPVSFRAEDRAGRPLAIHFPGPMEEAGLERLRRETRAAGEIAHLSPVRVIETGIWAGRPFVARLNPPGETLRERLGGRPLPVRELLGYGIAIAETLEATLAAGIVHCGLTPDWVVLSPDGEIGVAGFGYAWAQSRQPACTAPETRSEGPVDRRADLFGLGAVLWEMATGQPPPAEPPPPSSLRPDLPPLLDQIICTALHPAVGQRFQSAAGLARALTLFQRGDATAGNLARARISEGARRNKRRVHLSELRRRARKRALRIAVLLVLAVAAGCIAYLLMPRYEAFSRTQVMRLTESGDVLDVALSPDGTLTAQVRAEPAGESLWIQQVATRAARRLLPAGAGPCFDIAFSADSRFLHFVRGRPPAGTLYAAPVDGGEPRRLADGVAGAAVSPDGSRIAYLRSLDRRNVIVTVRTDGSGSDVALSRAAPAAPQSVAWSADGLRLAAGVLAPGVGAHIFTIDLESGHHHQLGWRRWAGPVSLAWLPGGDGLMLAGPEPDGAAPLWRIDYPDGGATPVTYDFEQYSRVSLAADGRSLAAVQTAFLAGLWVAAEGAAHARQITPGDRPDGVGGLDWTPDGRIVYASREGSNRGLWVVAAKGGPSHALLSGPDRAVAPRVSPGGAWIAFQQFRNRTPQIWTMTPDGRNRRPLTRGSGEALPSFSPDGATLYFVSTEEQSAGVWKAPFEGGRPEWLSRGRADFAVVSPDGRRLAVRGEASAAGSGEVSVISAADGAVETRLRIGEAAHIGWTRDSRALVWPESAQGVADLWAHPIDGSAAVRITSFTAPGEIFAFAWSQDWRQLAVSRGRRARNAVLVRDTGSRAGRGLL